ncbi:MAG: glycolate oxidase subunit GlcF, partial [Betaproteobacteria bacterium]|nr:glycolate oxidase subunit GlcF [Betaproteobacteria bacterium]
PRGRIYLINEMLQKGEPSAVALRHLDRCLTCRACETACPSGVPYGELADLGRKAAEPARRPAARLRRRIAGAALGNQRLMRLAGAAAAVAKPLLPAGLRQHFARRRRFIAKQRRRNVIMLAGCVENALSPQTHAALADILGAIGIGLINPPAAGCCGALRFHLNRQADGVDDLRRNVAAWAPLLRSGQAEAVVMTASGCQQMVADCGRLLKTPEAELVREKTLNIAELLERERAAWQPLLRPPSNAAVAYHSPCTMQNAVGLDGRAESLLAAAGYQVFAPEEKGVCCGSAGIYSLLQPENARRLRRRKLAFLAAYGADWTATANIGCQLFLTGGGKKPVLHWLELFAAALPPPAAEKGR